MSASATKKATTAKKSVIKTAPKLAEKDEPVFLGRGAEGLRLAQGLSRVVRGRPKRGAKVAGSNARAVRLPDAEWEALDAIAKKRGLTPHGAMREAIIQWLARAGAKKSG